MITGISHCRSIDANNILSNPQLSVSRQLPNMISQVQTDFNVRMNEQASVNNCNQCSFLIAVKKNIDCTYKIINRNDIIFYNAIKEWFVNEKRNDIKQSLAYLNVGAKSSLDDITQISTSNYFSIPRTTLKWCGDIIGRCCEEITQGTNRQLIPKLNMIISSPSFQSDGFSKISLSIKNDQVSKDNLKLIFNSLYKLFNENNSSERFLIAMMATVLRDYWHHNPPGHIDRDDIMKCTYQYADLFKVGGYVVKILCDNN